MPGTPHIERNLADKNRTSVYFQKRKDTV